MPEPSPSHGSGTLGPMGAPRLAAIDVGSNAMRLRIVEADGLREVASDRAPVRLGRDAFRDGALSRTTLDAAVRALRGFRAQMSRESVGAYRAVATSATRDAVNGEHLLERASREAGVDLELIDGLEEARLVHLGVERTVGLSGRTAVVDVGGGSTEISILERRRRVASSSLPLGTVRLLEAWHPEGGAVGRRKMGVLAEVVDRAIVDVAPHLARTDRIVATGGTVTAFAKLAGRDGHSVSVERMTNVLDRMRKMNEAERARTFGLRPDRSDTILPAAVVVCRVAAAAGAETIEAPGVGLRDGILAELADARRSARRDRSQPASATL
jgi:exopolyphosphatase/guanosine-5'-triphosphate,3'-diphosphate pyrophosphatase